MAQPDPSPAFSGADRIRSLTDEDAVFQAFDAYPWTKDTMFLVSLLTTHSPIKNQQCMSRTGEMEEN
jgi:hypothetical protein